VTRENSGTIYYVLFSFLLLLILPQVQIFPL
jgi:hypothetical protein